MTTAELPDTAGAVLIPIARAAIANDLGVPCRPPGETEPWLASPGACFVTLRRGGALRGCIGTIEPSRPLVEDVKANAVAAATQDRRFDPLEPDELDGTEIEVSVLTPAEPMTFSSEVDALAQLRPGVDGIVFSCGGRRSTFLPEVWEQLPDRRRFLARLKLKAGFSPEFWHPDVRLSRYTTRAWHERDLS